MKLDKFKKNLSTIILCGGKGKRLLPLTKSTPKLAKHFGKLDVLYVETIVSFFLPVISPRAVVSAPLGFFYLT